MLAVVFSIAYTILAAYESNWCWPAAIVGVLLSIYIYFHAKLYSETGLHVFYLVMAFYGWWQWRNNKIPSKKLNISELKIKEHLLFIIAGILLTCILYYIIKNFTDGALPLPDAFVTGFSLIATYLMAKKNIENWLWWIIIDGAAIFISVNRGLYIFAILYFIYVIIVVVAYFKWRGELQQQKA